MVVKKKMVKKGEKKYPAMLSGVSHAILNAVKNSSNVSSVDAAIIELAKRANVDIDKILDANQNIYKK